MASTTRPTHYDVLGLKPTATADDIDRAFAREIVRPRPLGGLAQIGVAHATLRDPAKRRSYDQSIGLFSKPAPVMTMSYSGWVTAAAPVVRTPPVTAGVTRTPVAPAAPSEPADAPARETFIAASLRALADPEPLVRSAPEAAVPARPPIAAREEIVLPDIEVQDSPIAWRRPAIIGGGLTLAAVLFGAWAGSTVGDPAAPVDEEAEVAVTTAVPAARVRTGQAASSAISSTGQPSRSDPVETPKAARYASVRLAQAAPPTSPRPVALTPQEEQELAGGSFVESATGQAATVAEAIAPAATAAEAAARPAKLPLSGRTIARTIGRIGYACGSVASITEVDGSAGMFKVTCASGDSYQARPVRGRYHFRRWGRN